jgi:hypothetical protein
LEERDMFIKFNVIEKSTDEPVPEICTFNGIRYDRASHLAILSTEHSNHDYLMPVESVKEFTYLSDKLYGYLSKALIHKGFLVCLEGSAVYRVPKGSETKILNISDYKYRVKAVHDDVSFDIGKLFRK